MRGLGAWGLGRRARGLGLMLLLSWPLLGGSASAQATQQVEPIRCWRQASAGAVTIGETFTLTVTCAVFETADTQVVPDESRLNVASIQMAPFEILGGSHPPDVRRGARRFFQYDYQVRIISPDAIGHDVQVPALTLTYRVHSRVGAAAKLEGRDLSYLLPALPIKVLSMVPADASDIRDASVASLAAVDSLRFRSRLFEAVAIALALLAAATVLLALVSMARRAGADGAVDRPRVPDRAVLRGAIEELEALKTRTARDGWSDAEVSRALDAGRVIAAVAIGRQVSQKPLPASGNVPEGRLAARHGVLRPLRVSVASPVTADDVGRAVAGDGMSVARQQQLQSVQSGIAVLTAAQYSRSASRDAAALDEAVRQAIGLANEVSAERSSWTPWAKR
jgi:hypothetical protein